MAEHQDYPVTGFSNTKAYFTRSAKGPAKKFFKALSIDDDGYPISANLLIIPLISAVAYGIMFVKLFITKAYDIRIKFGLFNTQELKSDGLTTGQRRVRKIGLGFAVGFRLLLQIAAFAIMLPLAVLALLAYAVVDLFRFGANFHANSLEHDAATKRSRLALGNLIVASVVLAGLLGLAPALLAHFGVIPAVNIMGSLPVLNEFSMAAQIGIYTAFATVAFALAMLITNRAVVAWDRSCRYQRMHQHRDEHGHHGAPGHELSFAYANFTAADATARSPATLDEAHDLLASPRQSLSKVL